jgi:chromosome partitioning protein
MTKVISFISRKGGSGKTTNAINLATFIHAMGKKVIVFETDPNFTLIASRKMELFKGKLKDDKLFPILPSSDVDVSNEIQKISSLNKYDYIIIDSAGKTTDSGIKELCLSSDLVIITTSLTHNDLLVTYQTVKDLKPAKSLKPSLKLFILPNRIHCRTRIATIKEILEKLDIEMFDIFVPQKKQFTAPSTIHPEKRYKPIAQQILTVLK